MNSDIDHLVVAARTLEEGAAWVEEQLGVATVPGGKHALMGTHNRLLRLGPRVYLEVIAIDPEASAPGRPRWFALDSPQMQSHLARGPALIHWVARTGDIEAAARESPGTVEILSASRGAYRWRIGIAPDGRLPAGGMSPTLIQWEGDHHPADALPDSGCTLVELSTAGSRLEARISTPGGERTLA